MNKSFILAISVPFILSACTEEAAAPVQDEAMPEESMSSDVAPAETMPDGVVQDENAMTNGTADSMEDMMPAEEDAKAAMEMPETEETVPTE